MSGNERPAVDRTVSEPEARFGGRTFAPVVRRILDEIIGEEEVNWILQDPRDDDEEEVHFFVWTDSESLQIRAARRRRSVPDEATNGQADGAQSHEGDSEIRSRSD